MANRKKGENMYALKRPERALYAMFATYFMNKVEGTKIHEMEQTNESTYHAMVENDAFDYLIMIFATMLLGILVWLCIMCNSGWTITWTPWITSSGTTAGTRTSTRESSAQTDRTGLEEERLIQLRKSKVKLTDEVAHLQNEWALTTQRLHDERQQVQILHRNLMKLKEEQETVLQQKLKVAKQKASLKPIYLASMGGCWHARRACVAQRTANLVYERQPCKACSHLYLEDCTPQAPMDGVHWSEYTHGDLTGTATSSTTEW